MLEPIRQLRRATLIFLLSLLALTLTYFLPGWIGADLDGEGLNGFPNALHKVAMTLAWLATAWLAGRLFHVLMLNPVFQARGGRDAPIILGNLISLTLVVLALFTVVGSIWQSSLGALVATSGIITLILGLALREMITDFFSGIALNLEQPYRLGDWLEMDDGPVGEVVAINWRATHLRLNDKRMIVVPNGLLARNRFINYSFPTPEYRENLALVFNYNIDPKRVENILMSAVLATPGMVPKAKHRIRIDAFEPRGVLFEVKFWLPTYADLIPVKHKLAVNIMTFLDQAGIPLPYVTHEVHTTPARPQDRETRINNDALLRRVALFAGFSKQDCAKLALAAQGVELAAGTEVITEGDPGESLYVVVEGLLSVEAEGQQLGQLYPGETFGERAVLTGEPRSATVNMVTAGYLLKFGRDAINELLQERPAVADMLAHNMVHRDSVNRRLADQLERREPAKEASRVQEIRSAIRDWFGL